MNKYKVGDKFEIEIEQVLEGATKQGNPLYRIKGFRSLVFDDYGLSLMKRIKTEVDWSKVAVDTPILVRDYENEAWDKRYFAEYKDGYVYAWVEGKKSWSSNGSKSGWMYAKLAEVEE